MRLFKDEVQSSLLTSSLFDEKSFYKAFIKDLLACQNEVIIESPYITSARMEMFYPVFEKLIKQGVKVYVVTRDPREHFKSMEEQSEEEIQRFERLGVHVFLCIGNHHRKLAILDRKILWEGSLNILSQTYSREIMRRINGKRMAMEMFNFLKLDRFI